jgi:protein involved in polysaccharide export with SLBB domain
MGEVSRPGVYSLTNRKITVKMALAAAGNLGPMAWPENAMLIRRVGDSEELMIPLNVEAIARGDEPDLFLKADDVLAVGTHVASTFMLVVKNAFRLTYGFGFIYDRNFSDPYTQTLDSKRFSRW